MKVRVSTFRKALREAFTHSGRDLEHDPSTDPMFTPSTSSTLGIDDVDNRDGHCEVPEIEVSIEPETGTSALKAAMMHPEEESASRERQAASGYDGAIDGPPDYGDDMSMSMMSLLPKEMTGGDAAGNMPFDSMDLADDSDEGMSMNHLPKQEDADDEENTEEGGDDDQDDSEQDSDDDSDEEDSQDDDSEDSDESEESSDDDSDGEDDEDSEEDSEDDGDSEVEKEGVSQSKRAAHGYDLEDPDDYNDLPSDGPHGHSLGRSVAEAYGMEEDSLSPQDKYKRLDKIKNMVSLRNGEQPGAKKLPSQVSSPAQSPEAVRGLAGIRQLLSKVHPQELASALAGGVGTGSGLASHMEDESESPVSQDKAKTIMKHGEIGDKPLTDKQKGLFGLIAGGGKPSKLGK